jgi:hypothetical protein
MHNPQDLPGKVCNPEDMFKSLVLFTRKSLIAVYKEHKSTYSELMIICGNREE